MAIEIRGIAPLIQVYDMPTAVHFYRDLLGFELVTHSPFYARRGVSLGAVTTQWL